MKNFREKIRVWLNLPVASYDELRKLADGSWQIKSYCWTDLKLGHHDNRDITNLLARNKLSVEHEAEILKLWNHQRQKYLSDEKKSDDNRERISKLVDEADKR